MQGDQDFAEDDFLAAVVGEIAADVELNVRALQAEPLALQRRHLHAWLKAHGVPDVGFAEVEGVRRLFGGRTAKTNLPGGWHARRRAGKLFLESPQNRLSD